MCRVKCVQTLSRLNRTYKDKQTFILDFVNSVEEIQESFKPYYESTEIKSTTDPNSIFDKFYEIKEFPIYDEEKINEFAVLYFKKKRTEKQDAKLNSLLDEGVEMFLTFDDEVKDEFKGKVREYLNLYKFLLQIYPIKKLDLLKLYIYLIGLYKKLPKDAVTNVDLEEILSLDYYKLSKISEGNISIDKGEGDLTGVGNGRGGKEEKLEGLDEIIARINDIYGIGLTEENKIMLENIEKIFVGDSKLQQMAKVNSQEDFTKMFGKTHFKRGLIRQKKDFSEVIKNILSNEGLSNYLMNVIAEKVYEEMQEKG